MYDHAKLMAREYPPNITTDEVIEAVAAMLELLRSDCPADGWPMNDLRVEMIHQLAAKLRIPE